VFSVCSSPESEDESEPDGLRSRVVFVDFW
jgi:hypothetical protein